MDEREGLARILGVAFRALSETSRNPEVVARAAWDALREIERLAGKAGARVPADSDRDGKEGKTDRAD